MSLTRRELLAAAAIATATASTRLAAERPGGIMLVDPAVSPLSHRLADGYRDRRRIALETDFVRQWRDGLEQSILEAGGALALVRWDKALLLTGLAREAGLRAEQQRLGRSTFLLKVGRIGI